MQKSDDFPELIAKNSPVDTLNQPSKLKGVGIFILDMFLGDNLSMLRDG